MAKPTPNKLSNKVDEIILKYNQKVPVSQMAKEYDVTISAIYKLLKNNNVATRNPSDEARKYVVDEDFFEVIDTEHKAYWLGFLYADGYVSSTRPDIKIQLQRRDRYILEEFVADLNSTYPVKDYIQRERIISDGKMSPSTDISRVCIRSKKLHHDLCKNGCIPNKSLVLEFPTVVPDELLRHFIRGYFDGDGCITYNNTQKNGDKTFCIKFCGTKEFLNGVYDYFEKITSVTRTLYKRRNDNKNTYSLEIGGNIKVSSILDELYRDATIYLDRKFDRYKELKTTGRSGLKGSEL